AFNLISTSDQAGGSLLSRAESTFNLKETSAAARLAIWRQSLESFKQDPIAGIGNGNFSLIFVPRDQSGTFEQLTQQLNDALKIPHIRISAHNTYIHILVESGLLGFLAFLGFILVTLRQAYKSYKAENILAWRLYAAALAMALIWLFTYNVFDAVFLLDYQPQLFFWLSLALLTMPQSQTSEA
ncbi:MAG TPA: O-antigen ligase family protein, partial [Flavobacterium sp.]|nr:O-antigen ligase family protein [Flavobacterium sp.]